MSKDQSQTQSVSVIPPIPSADEIYDSLMASIEPELTSDNLSRIVEMTANETLEQRTTRADRYMRAFEAYDKKLLAHFNDWNQAFALYKKSSMKQTEVEVNQAEGSVIQEIENGFDTSLPKQ